MTETRSSAPRDLTRFAWLSIATAVVTIALKTGAWYLTGSVGLLSDAAESVVNLVAAFVALIALRVAAKPADKSHLFGHSKAEYFSAAVEGMMIFVAAIFIIVMAIERLINPAPIENVGIGLGISVVAAVLNGGVAVVLLRAGRRYRSNTLVADGKHLMTDVWTTGGVLVGVFLVAVTQWQPLDPIVALLVGVNIVVTGWKLLSESIGGLMDVSWPKEENRELARLMRTFTSEEVDIHALRTREAGHHRYVEFHLLVPGAWTVQQAHDLCEDIEEAIDAAFDGVLISSHIEPREDPRAYSDFDAEVALPTD
ncbi:cation diffusion facilitator family transporter [Mobilicoccus caccae]|uniref:Transporter n=1 Tax=Mobilicoccus caccae TaxID=1859295 RepID=A0ABQ6INX5_9MICO|nr:cation diffusion facilitator family transporter [Mobilicoccus caccae]GMA39623.1 transporter [Mobilicoccus caccae]